MIYFIIPFSICVIRFFNNISIHDSVVLNKKIDEGERR